MKKLFVLLSFAGFLTACNDSSQKEGSTGADTATTQQTVTPAPSDTTSAAATSTALKDSVMQFKDGKVQIIVGGSWSPLSAAVTTTNGRKVTPEGEISKNGKARKMEEGMMIDKDGQLMDKDGKAVDNTGWE